MVWDVVQKERLGVVEDKVCVSNRPAITAVFTSGDTCDQGYCIRSPVATSRE
jgi:hypothetical protein